MTSRKIKLKRKEIIRFGTPQELKDEKICILGSYIDKNGNPARALSYDLEDKWMSEIVNLKVTDAGFRAAVTTWYKNMRVKVLPEGVEWEIGEDASGNPLNLEDWVKWKFALSHPWMAKNKKECEGVEHYQFYFEDPEAENIIKGNKLEQSTKAYVEFAKLNEDTEKMDWVLRTILGKFSELGSLSELIKLDDSKKKLKIAFVIEKDPQYFLDIMSDKDLIYKAEIASMVEAGVLNKEGNKYLNGSENLGSIDGTIAWMKDANNSMDYAILKARLDEFGIPVAIKLKEVKVTKPKEVKE